MFLPLAVEHSQYSFKSVYAIIDHHEMHAGLNHVLVFFFVCVKLFHYFLHIGDTKVKNILSIAVGSGVRMLEREKGGDGSS